MKENLVEWTLSQYKRSDRGYYDPLLSSSNENNNKYKDALTGSISESAKNFQSKIANLNGEDVIKNRLLELAKSSYDREIVLIKALEKKNQKNLSGFKWPELNIQDPKKYIDAFKNISQQDLIKLFIGESTDYFVVFINFLNQDLLKHTFQSGDLDFRGYLQKQASFSRVIRSYANKQATLVDVKKTLQEQIRNYLGNQTKRIPAAYSAMMAALLEDIKKSYGRKAEIQLETYQKFGRESMITKAFSLNELKEYLEDKNKDKIFKLIEQKETNDGEEIGYSVNLFKDIEAKDYEGYTSALLEVLKKAFQTYLNERNIVFNGVSHKQGIEQIFSDNFKKNIVNGLKNSYTKDEFLQLIDNSFSTGALISGSIGEIIANSFLKSHGIDSKIFGQQKNKLKESAHVDIGAQINNENIGIQVKQYTTSVNVFDLYDTSISIFSKEASRYFPEDIYMSLRYWSANYSLFKKCEIQIDIPSDSELERAFDYYLDTFIRYDDLEKNLNDFFNNFYILNFKIIPASLIFSTLALEFEKAEKDKNFELENFYTPIRTEKEVLDLNLVNSALNNYGRINFLGIHLDLKNLLG